MFGLIPFRSRSYDIDTIGNEFEELINRFFNDDFLPSFNMNMNSTSPIDIKENEDNYAVRASLPGVNKDDISLEYKNNNLIISAKRNAENNNDNRNYMMRQRCSEQFTRSFYIDNVDEANIRARFVNNELQVILPKKYKTPVNSNRIKIE